LALPQSPFFFFPLNIRILIINLQADNNYSLFAIDDKLLLILILTFEIFTGSTTMFSHPPEPFCIKMTVIRKSSKLTMG